MFGAFFPAWALAAMHGLDRVADRQLEVFRPALPVDEPELERTRGRLTSMPAGPVAALTAAAALLPTVLFIATEDISTAAGVPAWALAVALLALTSVTAVLFMYHAIHQLRTVAALHDRADVDLLRPGPLAAFSVLAARSGICFVALAWYAVAVRPDLVLSNPVGLGLVAGVLASGAATFFLPLLGLHRRLAAEKSRRLDEADDRLARLIGAVWSGVDRGAVDAAGGLDQQLASVERTRAIIAGRPTWPWATPTLTGFVSAFLLPVAIWAVTFLAERAVG
jgi:hypothetical protein